MKQVNKSPLYTEIELQFQKVENKKIKQAIDNCIECKILSYHRFLITKLDFKELNHRKIVQNIFSKYIPEKRGVILNCNVQYAQNQEEITEILNWLGEVMKQLPNNLQNLELRLYNNNLGGNAENLKWLGETMKQLPNRLKNLELNLFDNNLGRNTENLKYLCEGIQQLPKKLQNLKLNLSWNNLGGNSENMKILGEAMKQLPDNLQNLGLGLWKNNLGKNSENLKYLGEGIKYFPNNWQNIKLYLNNNNLGENTENLNMLGGVPNNVKNLNLDLEENGLDYEDIKKLKDDFQELQARLKKLDLSFCCIFYYGQDEY